MKEAHAYCKNEAETAVKNKTPVVIINNTNVKLWEFKSYVNLAKENGYRVVIMEVKTPWAWDAIVLSQKSTHNVPLEMLEAKVSRP